jgi:hypothetical protein
MAEPTRTAGGIELLYARILEIGVAVALPLLLLTFGLYAAGIVEPAVPISELPRYWGLSSHEYLAAINVDYVHRAGELTGWSWVGELHHGDYLTYIPIALLPTLTMVCYLAIIPRLLRQGDRLYAGIAVLEMVILSLAASGLLKAAGH